MVNEELYLRRYEKKASFSDEHNQHYEVPGGSKREKSLCDYLALNKVKHSLNALGGIGLATNGVLLLNKQTVPAQTLGTALAMGGTYIAGKNMYDLINDFSKK
jgi:hypothetical protein